MNNDDAHYRVVQYGFYMPPTLMDAQGTIPDEDASNALTRLFRQRPEHFMLDVWPDSNMNQNNVGRVGRYRRIHYTEFSFLATLHLATRKEKEEAQSYQVTVLGLLPAQEHHLESLLLEVENERRGLSNDGGGSDGMVLAVAGQQETKLARQIQDSQCFPIWLG